MQWGNDDVEARRARWMEYIRSVFSEPQPGFLPMPETPPSPKPRPAREKPVWRKGMLARSPISDAPDALPFAFYIILSDPDKPLVRLCLAGRDVHGVIRRTDRTVLITRERLDTFEPASDACLF